MKDIFEGIASIFEIILTPFSWLRDLEQENWWLANTVSWLCIIVLAAALFYWCKQLRIFEANGEEDHTQTAHSFLGKDQK